MSIIFANPQSQNLLLENKLTKIFKKTIRQKNYILGDQNKKFEDKIKKYFNIDYVIGVNSGTDALKIAIKSLGLPKNAEVILPSLTATATGTAVLEAGANPIIIDIDSSGNIDPEILKKTISKKTKAIIVVHLHGNMANINEIKKIAKKIPIIEDCAQSFGSNLNKKKAGTFGTIACFSFYPTKNLAAIGDGGAIITNDKKLYSKMKSIRQYGWNKDRISNELGFNSRLDEIQAAILDLKLNYIDKNNLKRNKIADKYIESFKKLPITFPKILKGTFHNYHLFVIMTKERNKLLKYLNKKNIFPSIHYQYPLHKMPTFRNFKFSKMKCADKMSNMMLSLPMYPELKIHQQNKVINEINKYFKSKK
ncbi:DegT/DnrJ/EryC1/StrS family aminotransferase [Candidatus Pelagibacter sp.]|nr:DegT/DnrJ/EryC1/StrS family aminotransferase [Candidatus Pelagibacter sp.]